MKRTFLIICLILLVVIASMALFACNSDKDNFDLLSIYVNRDSVGEFTKAEVVCDLPSGYDVSLGNSNNSYIHRHSEYGYQRELNGVYVYSINDVIDGYQCLNFIKDGKNLLFNTDSFNIIQMQVYYGNIFIMTSDSKILVYDFTNSKWIYSIDNPLMVLESTQLTKSISALVYAVSKDYFVTIPSNLTYASQFGETKNGLKSQYFFVFSSNGNMIGRINVTTAKLSNIEGFDSYVVISKNTSGDDTSIDIVSFNGLTAKSDVLISPNEGGSFILSKDSSAVAEATYFGGGTFLVHIEEKGNSSEYFYVDSDENYWNVTRYIYNAKTSKRTTYRSDIMMLSIENEYYKYSSSKSFDSSQFLKSGYSYVGFGMVRKKDKTIEYDRFIIKNKLKSDGTFEIVNSLTKNYGKLEGQYDKIKSDVIDTISVNELVMTYVDEIGVVQVSTGILNIYDRYGKKLASNGDYDFQTATYNSGVVLCSILDEENSTSTKSSYLYGAIDTKGNVVVPFVYSKLTMFTGYYAIGEKADEEGNTCYYLVGKNGYSILLADKNGSVPGYNFLINKSGNAVYKTGCYLYYTQYEDELIYGIKSTAITNGKNILVKAEYTKATLYAPTGGFGEVYAIMTNDKGVKMFRLK